MTDTQFHLLAGVLAMISVVVLIVALFRDRPKNRRRCPKCWYDLSASGADNRRCSECGYIVHCEKKLHKTRRHWRWASVGVMVLVGALAIGMTPKVKRDGLWSVAPNTVLILMAPDADDAFVSTPIRDKAIQQLVEQRLQIQYSNSVLDSSELWDWQWRMLCRKAAEYVDVTFGSWGDSGYRMYQRLLVRAVGNGIVHRIRIAEEVCGIRDVKQKSRIYLFSPHRRRNGTMKFFSDQPIGFGLYVDGPFAHAVDPKEITITLDDDPQPLRWERTERPYFLGCISGETSWLGVFYLPPDLADGSHHVTFRLREYVDYLYASEEVADDLFVAEYTLTYTFETAGSYQDFIRPDFDPRLDDLVRPNVSLEIDIQRRAVCVHINPYWLKLSSWIGKIWRLELVRDGEVIDSKSRVLNETDCIHFSNLPQYPDVFMGNIEGDWMLRFQMDPETMILWNKPSDYWGGVIEVPIDWDAEREKLIAPQANN